MSKIRNHQHNTLNINESPNLIFVTQVHKYNRFVQSLFPSKMGELFFRMKSVTPHTFSFVEKKKMF